MNRRLRIGMLLGLSLTGFLLFLDEPDIVTSHEARVALAAREMADCGWPWTARLAEVQPVKLFVRAGVPRLVADWNAEPFSVNPWLVPTVRGQIRLQEPPLPYWCAATTFRLCGGFSEFTVRLVPALLGALAVLLMYDLASQLFGRQIGWLSALVWVSTYSIREEYRKAMADPYLAFFVLACVWSWVRASRADAGARPSPGGENSASTTGRVLRSFFLILVFYLCFGLALLAKGPPAIIDILLPLAVFHLCVSGAAAGWAWVQVSDFKIAQVLRFLLVHAAGVVLMLAIALPWPIYVLRYVPHATELWRYESVGEMSDNLENAGPWYFHVPQLFYLALPWTALWVVGISRQVVAAIARIGAWVRRRILDAEARRLSGFPVSGFPASAAPAGAAQNRPGELGDWRRFFPLSWSLVTLIFFSCVHLKKNQYLLPALPAQTLLIAQGMSGALAAARKLRFRWQAVALLKLQTLLGIAFAVGTIVVVFKAGHLHGVYRAATTIALVASLLPLLAVIPRHAQAWTFLQATAFVLMFLTFSRFYLAPGEAERSAKQVAAELLALSRQKGWTILTTQLPEEVAIYLPTDISYDPNARQVLVILDDQQNMRARLKHPANIPIPNPSSFLPDEEATIKQVALKAAPGDARWKVWDLCKVRPPKLYASR